MAISSGYSAEDLARLGPDALTRKRLLAEALLGDATKQRRIDHPLQGLAQMADALVSGLRVRKLDQAEAAGQKSGEDAWSKVFGGETSTPSPVPMSGAAGEVSSSAPAGDMQPYRNAIASIESAGSGDYSAVGPTNPKLGRALGRYQIMEANIGPWSQEALGRTVTPDEFLADPRLQDAIFDKKFGSYVSQYGPEGAAQAWFAGPGGVGQTDRKDVLGTTVGDYGQKFRNALGPQVASLDQSVGMPAAAGQMAATSPAPALPPPTNVATPPVPPNAPAPQQLAQALTGGASAPPQSGPSVQALAQILSNPWVSDDKKKVAQMLLGQQLEQNDPLKKLQLRKSEIELHNLEQPPEPESVRALRLRASDAGLQPGTPEYSKFMQSGGRGPLVSVNTGDNSSKFIEESDKAAAGRLNDYVQAGNGASQMMGDIQTLADLGAQIKTGLSAQTMANLGPYAESLGIDVKGLGPAQAYQSIVNKIAPQMRPAGSGSSSDTDVRMFLNALPSLKNDPDANAILIDTFKAIQQNKIDAADLASKAYLPKDQGGLTWQEAEKQIRSLPNPYERFKTYQKGRSASQNAPAENPLPATPQSSPAAPSVGAVEDGYRFKGGDPKDPKNWEQAL